MARGVGSTKGCWSPSSRRAIAGSSPAVDGSAIGHGLDLARPRRPPEPDRGVPARRPVRSQPRRTRRDDRQRGHLRRLVPSPRGRRPAVRAGPAVDDRDRADPDGTSGGTARGRGVLEVREAGTANALALWFSADLAPGIDLSVGPGDPPTHWGMTTAPLRASVELLPGMEVHAKVRIRLLGRRGRGRAGPWRCQACPGRSPPAIDLGGDRRLSGSAERSRSCEAASLVPSIFLPGSGRASSCRSAHLLQLLDVTTVTVSAQMMATSIAMMVMPRTGRRSSTRTRRTR